MTIFGRVIDNQKKSAIQGATVSVLNADLSETDVTGITDDIGRFSISSNSIDLGSIVLVSHSNYHSNEVIFSGTSDLGFISLIQLPPVAERQAEQVPKNNSWLWLLGALGLLYILSNKKRK